MPVSYSGAVASRARSIFSCHHCAILFVLFRPFSFFYAESIPSARGLDLLHGHARKFSRIVDSYLTPRWDLQKVYYSARCLYARRVLRTALVAIAETYRAIPCSMVVPGVCIPGYAFVQKWDRLMPTSDQPHRLWSRDHLAHRVRFQLYIDLHLSAAV